MSEIEVLGAGGNKNRTSSPVGHHVVFRNTFCRAMYKVDSKDCVKVYFSDIVANPGPTTSYQRLETGTDIDVFWNYEPNCSGKKDLHMSIYPCDGHKPVQATYSVEEGQPCSIKNVTSTITFNKYYLTPKAKDVCFDRFKFNNQYCQDKHGYKLEYDISLNKTDVTPPLFVAKTAVCYKNDTCCFHVDEKNFHGQTAYVHAFFDGIRDEDDTYMTSEAFDIIRCSDTGKSHFEHSKYVDVPIDEVKALTLKVSPTYMMDTVMSVTLKSFRKVVGYDTFDSIRKQDRAEKKDLADYYNVTMSAMIMRYSMEQCNNKEVKLAVPELGKNIDKGFPYDEPNSKGYLDI